MSETIEETQIVAEIEAFCEASGMSPTDFGREALGDSGLMTTLKKGRELRRATRAKIRDYIKNAAAKAAE